MSPNSKRIFIINWNFRTYDEAAGNLVLLMVNVKSKWCDSCAMTWEVYVLAPFSTLDPVPLYLSILYLQNGEKVNFSFFLSFFIYTEMLNNMYHLGVSWMWCSMRDMFHDS